jgi:hypothetical protein
MKTIRVKTNWDRSMKEKVWQTRTMASVDLVNTTEEYEFQTKKMLNSIEKELVETTELGCSTAAALAKQDETLEHVQQGMKDVKRSIKRTHKLLDTFSKWSSFGFGKSKSRKAGRRIGKDFEADARFEGRSKEKEKLKKNKLLSASKEKGVARDAGLQSAELAAVSFKTESFEWSTGLEDPTGKLSINGVLSQTKVLQGSSESSYSRAEERQLDRIHDMVSNLGEISKDISITLEEQSKVISAVDETMSKQLKKTTKAHARSAWHLNKNRE